VDIGEFKVVGSGSQAVTGFSSSIGRSWWRRWDGLYLMLQAAVFNSYW